MLAFALLAASQKDVGNDRLSSLADEIVQIVIGKDGRGNKEADDDWLVHIVANRVFRKLYGYELRYGFSPKETSKLQLRPIVRSILAALERTGHHKTGHGKDSEQIRIERKFKENQRYYLSRAGMPQLSGEYLEKFEQACQELKNLGVETDFGRLKKI